MVSPEITDKSVRQTYEAKEHITGTFNATIPASQAKVGGDMQILPYVHGLSGTTPRTVPAAAR